MVEDYDAIVENVRQLEEEWVELWLYNILYNFKIFLHLSHVWGKSAIHQTRIL